LLEDRNVRRQKKIQDWEKRIKLLHEKYPRLEEISRLHTQMALELALLGLGKGRMGLSSEELEQALQSLQDEKKRIIRDNGLPENIYEVLWDCPACEDTGYVSPGVKCSCLLQEELRERYNCSGLSPEQEKQTFATFSLDWYKDKKRYSKILETCISYAEKLAAGERTTNMLLTGSVGTGKTHLCSAIANRIMDSGKSVLYLKAGRLMDLIRELKYGSDRIGYAGKPRDLQFLYDVDLLIIDDLGTESMTDFSKEQLLYILDERINNYRPWIISTNLLPNEIGQYYEDRISDRITGNAVILKFVGESVRLKKRLAVQE